MTLTASVEQLKLMLNVMPKGKKQMQRSMGTIAQAITSFEFDNSNKTWLAEKLSVLTQAATAEPFQCTEEVKQTIDQGDGKESAELEEETDQSR